MTKQIIETNDGASLETGQGARTTFKSISKTDWENFSTGNTTTADAAPNDELVVNNAYKTNQGAVANGDAVAGNPNQPAGGPLDTVTASLQKDVAALKTEQTGSQAYESTVTDLTKDEAALHSDVDNFLQSSAKDSDYVTFSNALESYHSALKSVATDLWDTKDPELQKMASETTAYYPLSHYQKYFNQKEPPPPPPPPPGGGDNPGPPAGATENSNLLSNDQKSNINPQQIGGSGNVESITSTSTGPNSDEITMTAKAGSGDWGDGLLLNEVHNSTTDQNVGQTLQLNKTFSFTQAQLDNANEYENDINNATGMHGTQINVHTGAVDAWDAANSKWVQVGSFGGPLEAGKSYNLQIDTHDNPDGSITYDGYYLNGKNAISSPATFGGKPLHWAPGDYIQTQLDFGGNVAGGAETGVTESDETLYVKNNS